MSDHVFVGFGFGPIQSGLFLHEAYQSGNFARLVVAEIDQHLVDAVNKNKGTYTVNIAEKDGIRQADIQNIEIYNPQTQAGRTAILDALFAATEISTSLPSVNIYTAGGENSPARLIADGLNQSTAPATIIYTGENNNHAAEILQQHVEKIIGSPVAPSVQFLNTVIGKMSQVVTDPQRIRDMNLAPIAPELDRAFLVESFNRILVTRCLLGNFQPGISAFAEKDDLLPFEEAKLYGHNAIHALLAWLAALKKYRLMSELRNDDVLLAIARSAFLDESGAALLKKYADLDDPLFTPDGFQAYADDLLQRMTNPHLQDAVERAARDPLRKLGPQDRIFGTMSLALEHDITPDNMALGALAGIIYLLRHADQYNLPAELRCDNPPALTPDQIAAVLRWLWQDQQVTQPDRLMELVVKALPRLQSLADL